jgi:hypothetical protein
VLLAEAVKGRDLLSWCGLQEWQKMQQQVLPAVESASLPRAHMNALLAAAASDMWQQQSQGTLGTSRGNRRDVKPPLVPARGVACDCAYLTTCCLLATYTDMM